MFHFHSPLLGVSLFLSLRDHLFIPNTLSSRPYIFFFHCLSFNLLPSNLLVAFTRVSCWNLWQLIKSDRSTICHFPLGQSSSVRNCLIVMHSEWARRDTCRPECFRATCPLIQVSLEWQRQLLAVPWLPLQLTPVTGGEGRDTRERLVFSSILVTRPPCVTGPRWMKMRKVKGKKKVAPTTSDCEISRIA